MEVERRLRAISISACREHRLFGSMSGMSGQRTEKMFWNSERMEQSMAWKSYRRTKTSLKWRAVYPVLLLSVMMGLMYVTTVLQQGDSRTTASSTSSLRRDQLYEFTEGSASIRQGSQARRSELLAVRSRVEGASLGPFLDACLVCRHAAEHAEICVDMHTEA